MNDGTREDIDLVVAANLIGKTGRIATTLAPMPLDGLPEWWRCEMCGQTAAGVTRAVDCPNFHPLPVAAGPFPVTVGIWEDDVLLCDGSVHDGDCRRGGAIVAIAEVPGPSHHADECLGVDLACAMLLSLRPDAAGDGWHTWIWNMRSLDVPIPFERYDDDTEWRTVTEWWTVEVTS